MGDEEIPVPPFSGLEPARRFHLLARRFVADLKSTGESTDLSALLLGALLSEHAPHHLGDGKACWLCGPPYPCRSLLKVAAISRFPAPWSPYLLAKAMRDADILGPTMYVEEGRVGWFGGDFSEHVERDPDSGSWSKYRHGKGEDPNNRQLVGGDAAMREYLSELCRMTVSLW